MDDQDRGGAVMYALLIAVAAAVACFCVAAAGTEAVLLRMGRGVGGENRIAVGLSALFIGGPIGGLSGLGLAGWFAYRWYARMSRPAAAIVFALAMFAAWAAVNFIVVH